MLEKFNLNSAQAARRCNSTSLTLHRACRKLHSPDLAAAAQGLLASFTNKEAVGTVHHSAT